MTPETLLEIAKTRFEEARILLASDKSDGAIYLCGYALELMLKRQVAKILGWEQYPDKKEFNNGYNSFRTHDLDILLHLSGLEQEFRADNDLYVQWQKAKSWNSEIRYRKVGEITKLEASGIIEASRTVLKYLNSK